MTTVRCKIHGSKSARRCRLEYAPAKVLRPWRQKVTTHPRKTYEFNSARRYCQNPLGYAPATVSGPEAISEDGSTQNPRVQQRVPLPPEPSRGQSPLEYAPAKVSRPSRPKVTTFPRKIHGSKSARRYRQSPLEYAHATVSRPSRPKVRTVPRKTHGSKSARRYRQSPLESLEYAPTKVSRFSRPKVTTFPRKTHGSKSARRYRQSPLEYAPARVLRSSGLGANSLVCNACWCALLGARW